MPLGTAAFSSSEAPKLNHTIHTTLAEVMICVHIVMDSNTPYSAAYGCMVGVEGEKEEDTITQSQCICEWVQITQKHYTHLYCIA